MLTAKRFWPISPEKNFLKLWKETMALLVCLEVHRPAEN